jgi:hypothetical protein
MQVREREREREREKASAQHYSIDFMLKAFTHDMDHTSSLDTPPLYTQNLTSHTEISFVYRQSVVCSKENRSDS